MAWTVPNGCYYACPYYKQDASVAYRYYSAGSSVPTADAPNEPNEQTNMRRNFILVDFANGYIYTRNRDITININANNTFTATSSNSYTTMINIIASSTSVSDQGITLTGSVFTFGNGSGMLDKSSFLHSTYQYAMWRSFGNRSDITNVTIPSGVNVFAYTFINCTNLLTVSGTLDLSCARAMFYGCSSLTTYPTFQSIIPKIESLGLEYSFQNCFNRCTSLTSVPAIPDGALNMDGCFYNCSSLAGTVTINSSPSSYANTFAGTVSDIILMGSGGLNATIASQYANVYAWALSSIITAQREENSPTTVDVSVDVTRFNTGTLSSLVLSKDGTAQAVTWNDPTLSITSIPTTFTTTILNIAEGDTPLISVVATDAYGSASAVSVRVPIAFYTMDVQAGGKEIAFGAIADDDLTNYPDGLFKCNMTMVSTQMIGEIKMWAGNDAPTGWLECDGSAISRTAYPLLFQAIGTLWGAGDGSTTFNLPDLQGKVPVGQDTSLTPDTDFDTVGDTGGAKTHLHTTGDFTLAATHLPAHTHGSKTVSYSFTIRRQGSNSVSAWGISNTSVAASSQKNITSNAVGTGSQNGDTLTLSASHTHDSVGGGSAHNHGNTGNGSSLQPYAVVKYIICAV